MGIFENNIAAIEKKYGLLAEKIREIDIEKASERIGLAQAANGMLIPWVSHQGRIWRLNSMQNPMEAAELYADRYQIRLYGIYFVFGFSDGRCVRELLNKCDDTNLIVVCVPDLELFAVICWQLDISDLIEEKRLLLYFSKLERNVEELLKRIVDYTRIKLLEFCILPGYDILYHDECEQYMDSVIECIRSEVVNKGTNFAFDRLIPQHILFHMKNLIYHKNIEQLRRALLPYDLSQIPVIVVSAGPSLDKNVKVLKKAKGKAYVIVVDAALKTVLRAGIRPDIVCTTDPQTPDRFFQDLNLEGLVWSCSRTSRRWIAEKFANDIFYHGTFGKEWNKFLEEELGYAFPHFSAGGSVSSEAFMLALYVGFRKIILIGQDLAFTGGVTHTKSVIKGTLEDNRKYIQSRMIMEVEGIDGTILETDFQMWYYKMWFEKVISLNKDKISVIDATEGGARIEGTEIQTLEEAIGKECRWELDMYELEKSIPAQFSKEKQRKLLEKLRVMKPKVNKFRRQIDEMIDRSEEILESLRNKSVSQKVLLEKLKDIMLQNEQIVMNPILDFIVMYAKKEEYEIGDCIYVQEEMKPEELVEKNLLLYKGYQTGAKLLEEDIDEVIMKN